MRSGPGALSIFHPVVAWTRGRELCGRRRRSSAICAASSLLVSLGSLGFALPVQRIPPPWGGGHRPVAKSVGTRAEDDLILVPYVQNKTQLGLSLAHRHLSPPPPHWDVHLSTSRQNPVNSVHFRSLPDWLQRAGPRTLLAARACSISQTTGQACIRDLRLSTYRRSEPVPTAPLTIQG